MAMILAIDPGPTESAFVVYDADLDRLDFFAKLPNDDIRHRLAQYVDPDAYLVVEMIASYGMPVGAEVFDTCVWIGRHVEAWGRAYTLLKRKSIVTHLCGSSRGKDGNVRQALIDRWGGKAKAIGNKRSPGALYGVSGDCWQALAVAVAWSEMCAARKEAA